MKTIFQKLMVAALGGLALAALIGTAQSPATSPVPASPAAAFSDCQDCPEMLRIPGQFFEVGKYEVTFAQWDACVAASGCNGYSPSDTGAGRGNRPVVNVSWNDAQAYVRWLSFRTKQTYRLLTSAEWEIAARAGVKTAYSWGDDLPVCDKTARNGASFISCTDDEHGPVVGSYKPNAFGFYDVHGSVYEWVEDCVDAECSFRAARGGSYASPGEHIGFAELLENSPTSRDAHVGFRVARGASVIVPEMVRIPGGPLSAEVGKYEVTFAEWDACVAAGGCNRYRPSDEGWGRGNRPVINVSWNDAQAYTQWLSQRTGQSYRLLTSAEWEIAARSGKLNAAGALDKSADYAWGLIDEGDGSPPRVPLPVCVQRGETMKPKKNGANFADCPDDQTRPVGAFEPNALGLYDVHGNVSEWVLECPFPGVGAFCSSRILRGGSWADRDVRFGPGPRTQPDYRDNKSGFRLARGAGVVVPEMVRIPGQAFEVGKYEVTFAEWDACLAADGCNRYRPNDGGWGRGNRPVINVGWHDAQAYVYWLSQRTGQPYRLLTSAEWEIAARGGTTTRYSWGVDDPVCDQSAANGANFSACTDNKTRPVGSFRPNRFGLYDMHGNVSEWTQDQVAIHTVIRGGSWTSHYEYLRFPSLQNGSARARENTLGFRVARTLF